MRTFAVVCRRDRYPYDQVYLHENLPSISVALDKIEVDGDLIVDQVSGKVVVDIPWAFSDYQKEVVARKSLAEEEEKRIAHEKRVGRVRPKQI